jgi:hypothetical protein
LGIAHAASRVDELLTSVVFRKAKEIQGKNVEPLSENEQRLNGGTNQATLDVRQVSLGTELAFDGEALKSQIRLTTKLLNSLTYSKSKGIGGVSSGHALNVHTDWEMEVCFDNTRRR